MGKNKKFARSMTQVGEAQQKTEQTTVDKFASTLNLAQPNQLRAHTTSTSGLSQKLSCTVTAEDKKILDELTVFATIKHGKSINVSSIIRSLIRNGSNNKESLEFD